MSVSRRRFLASTLGAGAAVALSDGIAGSATAAGAAQGTTDEARYVPFHGAHQHGIVTPPPAAGLMASPSPSRPAWSQRRAIPRAA